MKLASRDLSQLYVDYIVIPRGNNPIVFKAQIVLDFDEFNKLCPEPEPPYLTKKGGVPTPDYTDENYLKKIDEINSNRINWMILKSLQATEDLIWETVDMTKPETFSNFRQELKDAGFNAVEIGRIVKGVYAVNSLDDNRIEEARKSFLATVLPQNV